jgi:hypothetical protein
MLVKEFIVKNNLLLLLLALGLTAAVPAKASAKTTEILSGELALNHTLGGDIPIDKIKTHVDETDIAALHRRFSKLFGRFIDGKASQSVDFDFLMGNQNVDEAIKLHYLLGRIIDEGLPLTNFEDFGISRNDNGSYHFNFGDSPYLALPEPLFRRLTNQSWNEKGFEALRERGFRQSDLDIVRKHLDNNSPEEEMNRLSDSFSLQQLPKLKSLVASKMILNKESYAHYFIAMSYLNSYRRQNVWRNWGLKLMSQLGQQQQRILKSYLLEALVYNRTISATQQHEFDASLRHFEEQLTSGRYEKELRSSLISNNM